MRHIGANIILKNGSLDNVLLLFPSAFFRLAILFIFALRSCGRHELVLGADGDAAPAEGDIYIGSDVLSFFASVFFSLWVLFSPIEGGGVIRGGRRKDKDRIDMGIKKRMYSIKRMYCREMNRSTSW